MSDKFYCIELVFSREGGELPAHERTGASRPSWPLLVAPGAITKRHILSGRKPALNGNPNLGLNVSVMKGLKFRTLGKILNILLAALS